MIEQLERAAQFDSEDTNATKLDKLESLLAQGTSDVENVAPLFAPLMSIRSEGRYAPLEMTPERQKEQTLEALISQMEGLSRHRPVLLIFEDVHWADPTLLELLELTVGRVQRISALAVITSRPEFSSPWTGHSHVTSLTLNRFSRGLATAMVDKVTGGKPLPDEVRDQIIEKTDGVPLFVEELTKTVIESELLEDRGSHYALVGPLPALAIPSTLHDSLMARLDRFAPVREVAQTAAVIGREFSPGLLATVSPLTQDALRDALNQLVGAALIFRLGTPPRARYVFKHALVQDAAYESLLKSKRRRLHGRIAQALEGGLEKIVDTEPELLAHHYTEAGLVGPALTHWLRAGKVSAEHGAYPEAVAHLRCGLTLLETLPVDDARARMEIEFRVADSSRPMVPDEMGWPCASDSRQTGLVGHLSATGDHCYDVRDQREEARTQMDITNKTNRPISVPLPGSKKLFLGPRKTGQVNAKAAEHPPLVKLVEAGDLEIDETGRQHKTASTDAPLARTGSQASGPTGNIRRTGDR